MDGFRFDLMGHHPKANILAVRGGAGPADRSAADGVDGKKILLYGEGWNFGEVADDARFVQATQANMAGTGIGTFNDRLRDAVRGGGPFDGNPRVQGFASGLFTDPNGDPVNGTPAEQRARLLHYQDLIKVGLTGNLAGVPVHRLRRARRSPARRSTTTAPRPATPPRPGEAVTYVDAHDNEILYDALAYKLPPDTSAADRARMQVLALAHRGARAGHRVRHRRLRAAALQVAGPQLVQLRRLVQPDPLGLRRRATASARGLPPAADNQDKWPYAKPLLADPALVPDCAAIDLADARYAELLRIRGVVAGVRAGHRGRRCRSGCRFPLSGAGGDARA